MWSTHSFTLLLGSAHGTLQEDSGDPGCGGPQAAIRPVATLRKLAVPHIHPAAASRETLPLKPSDCGRTTSIFPFYRKRGLVPTALAGGVPCLPSHPALLRGSPFPLSHVLHPGCRRPPPRRSPSPRHCRSGCTARRSPRRGSGPPLPARHAWRLQRETLRSLPPAAGFRRRRRRRRERQRLAARPGPPVSDAAGSARCCCRATFPLFSFFFFFFPVPPPPPHPLLLHSRACGRGGPQLLHRTWEGVCLARRRELSFGQVEL